MSKFNILATALESRAKNILDAQGHYYIAKNPNGTYYGVLSSEVKSRSSAAQHLSPDYFIKMGLTPIKVKVRKSN